LIRQAIAQIIKENKKGVIMLQRGRILRDTSTGTGLISANGQQYEFKLEGMWKSDISPQANMVVEFELDDAGKVISVKSVSESDLAKEQAEKAMLAVKEKGGAVLDGMVAKVGMPVLIATGIVAISWFFLSAITVQAAQAVAFKIPFWNILSIANNGAAGLTSLQGGGSGSAGIYGLFAIFALAGPFLSQFWKDPKAYLGYCLPLVLMLVVAFSVYYNLQESLEATQNLRSAYGGYNKYSQEMASAMLNSVMQALHIGLGAYVAIIASSYLAFVGIKKFLAAKA